MVRSRGVADSPRRILFADFAVVKFNTLIQSLRKENVLGEALTDKESFLKKIADDPYEICVVNLLLAGTGPFELIRNVRKSSKNLDIKIIVLTKQVQKINIENTIKAGANDFVADPFEPEDLYQRILYHLAPKRVIEPRGYERNLLLTDDSRGFLSLLLESTETLSRTARGNQHEALLKVLQDAARMLDSNRTSLVIVDHDKNAGVVLASSDDPKFRDFPIALQKYPEIVDVMHTGNFVLVEDVARSTLTNQINDKVRSIKIGSIMVFPVRFQGDVVGVLTIRRPEATELPSHDILRVIQALANTLAAHSNIEMLLRKVYKDYMKKVA